MKTSINSIYFFLISTFICNPSLVFGRDFCNETNSLQNIQSAEPDMCLDAMRERYIGKVNIPHNLNGNERSKELERLTKAKYELKENRNFLNGPWDIGLIPEKEAQMEALNETALFFNDMELYNLEHVMKYLKSPTPKEITSIVGSLFGAKASSKSFKVNLNSLLTSKGKREFLDQIEDQAKISAACLQMGVSDFLDCVEAVKTIINDVKLTQNYILPQVWKDVLTTPKYQRGLRIAALKLIKSAQTQEISNTNILDDLTDSFIKSGLKKTEALNVSWKVLALYGNGGQNVVSRASLLDLPAESGPSIVSLSMIASAITVIDFNTKIYGNRHYAYPKGVQGSCLNTKPYHFWLSAYLARSLVQRGYNKNTAARATYILAKGYQLNRELANAGKGGASIIGIDPQGPVANVIRMDLALNSAGSIWGANSLESSFENNVNLEGGLLELKAASQSVQKISSKEADEIRLSKIKIFQRWDEIFKPNQGFEYILKTQENINSCKKKPINTKLSFGKTKAIR